MEGSGPVRSTGFVQLVPAVKATCGEAGGSNLLGNVGCQGLGESGRILQGEALMDVGMVLGQMAYEVCISQNPCLVSGHILFRMSREDILSVRPHTKCNHPNYPNCMIWDGIVYNFGPDSDEDVDPFDFFPLNLLSPPILNSNLEAALFEVPINFGPIGLAQPSPSHPSTTQQNQTQSSTTIPNIPINISPKSSPRSPNLKGKLISSKRNPNKKK